MTCSERGNFHHVFVRVFICECVVCISIPVLRDFLQCFIHCEFHNLLIRVGSWDFLGPEQVWGRRESKN